MEKMQFEVLRSVMSITTKNAHGKPGAAGSFRTIFKNLHSKKKSGYRRRVSAAVQWSPVSVDR